MFSGRKKTQAPSIDPRITNPNYLPHARQPEPRNGQQKSEADQQRYQRSNVTGQVIGVYQHDIKSINAISPPSHIVNNSDSIPSGHDTTGSQHALQNPHYAILNTSKRGVPVEQLRATGNNNSPGPPQRVAVNIVQPNSNTPNVSGTLRRTQDGILYIDPTPQPQDEGILDTNSASRHLEERDEEPFNEPGPPTPQESLSQRLHYSLFDYLNGYHPGLLQKNRVIVTSGSGLSVEPSYPVIEDITQIFRKETALLWEENSLCQRRYEEWKRRCETVKNERDRFQEDVKKMNKAHKANELRLKEFQSANQTLKTELEAEKRSHEESQTKTEELQEEYDSLKNQLEDEKRSHGDLKQKYDNLKAKAISDVRELQRTIDSLKIKATNEIQKLQSTIGDLERVIDKTEERVRAESAQELKDLKKEVEGISTALVAQESKYLAPHMNIEVNRLTDGDVKARFVELTQMVEDLARLPWKTERDAWTDELMDRLGIDKNRQTLMQKRILQDIIWTHLHQRIFCSPFRAFGHIGSVLETEWNQACGVSKDPRLKTESYTWPDPDIETERWRYVTITECRAALTRGSSKYDPRGIAKRDFIENSTALTSELATSLREIAVWDDDANNKSVMQLTRKATRVWLEYAVQRYRVLMSVDNNHATKPMSAAEKARQFEKGSLELVVVPGLGRYGNAKGYELAKYATIAGCSAEMYGASSLSRPT